MNLTRQQEEILRILQEECGEVTQIISKCCRFGIDERHLKADIPNRIKLTDELGDLVCMINLAIQFGIVEKAGIENAVDGKLVKLHKWSNIFKEV